MNQHKEFLFEIRSDPRWDEFEKHLLESRPIVPVFDPNADNSELWRHRSGQVEGFDILASKLKLEV